MEAVFVYISMENCMEVLFSYGIVWSSGSQTISDVPLVTNHIPHVLLVCQRRSISKKLLTVVVVPPNIFWDLTLKNMNKCVSS